MAGGSKIRVCIVDGLHADLAKSGVPLSVYCCNSKDFRWTALNGQQSREPLDFWCPSFVPGSTDNMGPKTVGMRFQRNSCPSM